MGLKQLLCRHHWIRYAKRRSNYCQDYVMFSDTGMWNDIMYKCTKCGKMRITHEANEQAIRAALAKFDPEVCTVENMIRVE